MLESGFRQDGEGPVGVVSNLALRKATLNRYGFTLPPSPLVWPSGGGILR